MEWTMDNALISEEEAAFLTELAASPNLPEGVIAELGSFCGRSTIALATGAQTAGRTVVAVDHGRGSAEWNGWMGSLIAASPEGTNAVLRANLEAAGLADVVEIVPLTTQEAAVGWDRPLALLFHDASHLYENVRVDLEAFLPFLVEGAGLLVHDYFPGDDPNQPDFPGVREAVAEVVPPKLRETLRQVGRLAVIGPWQKAKKR